MDSYIWLILAGLAAFFVAWNNGSNNAANAIGTVVGAKALRLREALIMAAVFDFIGAILFGRFVSATIMKGIVDVSLIESAEVVIKGMIAALIATGIWVLIASWFKIPMSISEGIVGGVIGFGLIAVGWEMINWRTVTTIISAWVILPFLSGLVALILYKLFDRMLREGRLLLMVASTSIFIMVFSTVFLLMVKTAKIADLAYSLGVATLTSSIALVGFILYYLVSIKSLKTSLRSDKMIKLLLLVAAASMAFSHGANDVANSAGPLSAVIMAVTYGYVPKLVSVDLRALAFAGAGIAIGIISWGYRVVETIGEKITTLTYSSAFIAQLSASITVLIVTRLGLPVSTTIAIVGSVAGVGLARGIKAVNLRVLSKIFITWIIALPAVIVLSMVMYIVLDFLL